MPTAQFQEALQALRVRDEQFTRRWQSPVPAERYDGLEIEAYAAAYLSQRVRQHPDKDELLVKIMRGQERRLTDILEVAREDGDSDYGSSRSFHNHVNLTIDAVLRPENYAEYIPDVHRDCYAQAFVRLELKALGLGRPKPGRQIIDAAGHAPSQQRPADRGRDEDDGPGWER